MIKKFLGLFIAGTIFVSSFAFSVSAKDKNKNAFEIAEFLNRIGISAVYNEDKYMTRGDFAVLAAETMKMDVFINEKIFEDVDGEQGKYINALANMGIISVNNEKKFYPDRIITVEEAAAILIRILGYDAIMADKSFPTGYRNEAIRLKILANVTSDAQVSGADAAHMIFNTLNCVFVEQVITSSDEPSYVLSQNTCLEQNFNVYKRTGMVTSICGLTLNGKKSTTSDYVIISGTRYENPYYAHVKNYTYLGHRVNYYIMKTEDSYEVVYIQDYTDVLEVYANDINRVVGFDSVDSANHRRSPELSYKDGLGKNRTIKLDVYASIYINAANKISVSNSDFTPETGIVYLTDSDSDGVYDVIFIEKYSYYYVSTFDSVDRVIADKYGKESLRLDDFDEDKILLEDGDMPLSDGFFKEGTVLEVMCSYKKDGSIDYDKFAKVSIADEVITGKINALDSEYYYINDNPYKALSHIDEEVRAQWGIECSYYLGCGDVIVAFKREVINDGSVYAYLVDIYPYGTIDKKYAFKMFSEKGEYLILDAADDLYYRGMYNGSYVNRKKLKEEDIENIAVKELIKFKTNDDGEITDIYSACDMSSSTDYIGYDESRFTLDYKKEGFLLYNGVTDDGYLLSATTPCIYISGDGVEEEDFEIGSYNLRGSVLGRENSDINLKIYDAAKNLTGTIAVIENAPRNDTTVGDKFYSASTMWVITDKRMALDEEGEFRCRLDVSRDGRIQRFFAKSDDLAPLNANSTSFKNVNVSKFTELEVGDVISVQLNTAGDISAYIVVNDYDETHELKMFQNYASQHDKDYLAAFRRMCGVVTKFVPGSYIMIDSGGKYSNKRFSIGRSIPTYITLNTSTGEVMSGGSATILNEGDYVWAYANKGELRLLVKYVK